MPAISITDLNNAQLDVTHIAAIATSTAATATDRLGNVKQTMAGVVVGLNAQSAITQTGINAATATAQAGLAATAKTAAETARDAANVNGKIYATTAAGLSGVASGAYFSVPSADSAEYLILYLNNAGAAVEQNRYPSTAKLAPFLSIAPTGYVWSLTDENGLAAMGILADGTLRVSKLLADDASATRLKLGTDTAIAVTPAGYSWALVDQDGNAALAVRNDGTLLLPVMQATSFNGILAKRITDLVGVKQGDYTAEVNQIISYGQSLSVGQSSFPLQTTSQPRDSVMFSAGVRAMGGTGTVAQNHAAFVPLIEASDSLGLETPCGQAAEQIKNLIESENGLAYTDHTYKILASAAGLTATVISGLQKGTQPYTNVINDVTYGLSNAATLSLTHRVQAVFWSQGESDIGAGTSYSAYLSALETLYQNLNTDIKSLAGPSQPDIKMIAYQVFYLGNSPATVALAQMQASKNNPNIIIACPNYFIERAGDGVHLTGPGSGMLGAYYGLVYKRVIVDGKVWKPVSPVSVLRQGKIALVKFNVPVRPLKLDTLLYTAQANSGFSLVDSAGTAIAVDSVTVVGPDTVKVVAATALTAGCKVRYGFNNGGNLRDSQGDTLFVQQKSRLPLHNWCVAFEETLS